MQWVIVRRDMDRDSVRPTQKLEVELDSKLLKKAQYLAKEMGMTLDSLIGQALEEFVAKFSEGSLDEEFLRAYRDTVSRYHTVFERLAKS